MNQNPTPARGVLPGRILSRELEARGWTQKDLAEIMRRPPQAISEIINGTKQITPETALELAGALGTSAELWLNLEANYQLWLAAQGAGREKTRDIARKGILYSLVPVRELVRRGWIRACTSADDLEREVFSFLGISSADELPRLAVSLRASESHSPEVGAQIAWVRRVQRLAAAQELGEFDLARLERRIPDILACAGRAEDVAKVSAILTELGVHFVLVPHLPKTYLDGAAFYLDGNPVVALSLRYDRIDAFWFTLMHELAHINRGHPAVYLENLDCEELAQDTREVEANQQAGDWLLAPAAHAAFVRDTQPRFSRAHIVRFAASQGRHPGIVVGRLQHDGLVDYRYLRPLLVRVRGLLQDWMDVSAPPQGQR